MLWYSFSRFDIPFYCAVFGPLGFPFSWTMCFICCFWDFCLCGSNADLPLHYADYGQALTVILLKLLFLFCYFFSLLNTIKKLIGNWWQKSLWRILASKLDWNILDVEVIYDISSEKENSFQRYCLCIPLHQIPSLSASPCFISFIIMCFEQLLNICTTSWRSSIREHCSLWGLFF